MAAIEAGRNVPTRRLTGTKRRRQLLGIALTLFAEKGYRQTTVEDIADAAGVTKPVVYQHFNSKRALYLELVDDVAAELQRSLIKAAADADSPRRQVEVGLAEYFHLLVTHRDAFTLLFTSADGDDDLEAPLRRVESTIVAAIEPLIDAGLEADHRRLLAYAFVGLAEGASRAWVMSRPETSTSPEQLEGDAALLAKRIADFAWAGLRSVHSD